MEKKHKRYLKLNLMSLFFVTVSFISVTLAWFAYTGFAKSGVDVDIKAWHIEFNGNSNASNQIVIPLTNIYPGMETVVETVTVKNKGDSDAKLSYSIDSVRILDEQLTIPNDQAEIIDTMTNGYPFSIDVSLSKQYLDANTGEATINLSVSWPIESDTDEDDSLWGSKTYDFQNNEKLKENNDSNYNAQTSIKVVIGLTAEQSLDKFTYNTGNMILYNPVDNVICERFGEDNCFKTNLISTYFNKTDVVTLLPSILENYGSGTYDEVSSKVSAITSNWTTDKSSLSLLDIIELVSSDVMNSKLIRSEKGLSDSILGYVTLSSRFDNFINDKVVKYNGYITFDSNKFDYLDSNSCYWLNGEYDIDRAFALTRDSEGVMKIYPESKSTVCRILPVIRVNKDKFYE